MLSKEMLKTGGKIDYLSILFGSTNKNSSLRIKLSVPWQRCAHRLPPRQLVRWGGLATFITADLLIISALYQLRRSYTG